MVQIVAILNSKGGSGKTSSAVNLAAALGEGRRRRVLVVDLDPQGSASAWLGTPGGKVGLSDVLQGSGMLPILDTSAPGVELVPADSSLVGIGERGLAPADAARHLRAALANLPPLWDIILLDTPPTLNALTLAALVVAGHAIIPTEASAMALAGVGSTVTTLGKAREAINPGLRLAGILLCRMDARTAVSRAALAGLSAEYGRQVFKATIRESARLRAAPLFQKPITTYAPTSTAAADYRAAAAELRRRLAR